MGVMKQLKQIREESLYFPVVYSRYIKKESEKAKVKLKQKRHNPHEPLKSLPRVG